LLQSLPLARTQQPHRWLSSSVGVRLSSFRRGRSTFSNDDLHDFGDEEPDEHEQAENEALFQQILAKAEAKRPSNAHAQAHQPTHQRQNQQEEWTEEAEQQRQEAHRPSHSKLADGSEVRRLSSASEKQTASSIRQRVSDSYEPYRPYTEPLNANATAAKPSYTSSRPTPTQLAWRSQASSTSSSDSPNVRDDVRQRSMGGQTADSHNVGQSSMPTRRENRDLRDMAARRRYAAAHQLGAFGESQQNVPPYSNRHQAPSPSPSASPPSSPWSVHPNTMIEHDEIGGDGRNEVEKEFDDDGTWRSPQPVAATADRDGWEPSRPSRSYQERDARRPINDRSMSKEQRDEWRGFQSRKDSDRWSRRGDDSSEHQRGRSHHRRNSSGWDATARPHQHMPSTRAQEWASDGARPRRSSDRYSQGYDAERGRGRGADQRYRRSGFGDGHDRSSRPKRGGVWDEPVVTVQGELIYGAHPVVCALQARRRDAYYHLYLQDNKSGLIDQPPVEHHPNPQLNARLSPDAAKAEQETLNLIMRVARQLNIPHSFLPRKTMSKLTDERPHNGYLLDCAPIRPPIVHSAHDLERIMRRGMERINAKDETTNSFPSDQSVTTSTSLVPPSKLASASSPVSPSSTHPRLWVLFDEVMDPQNLGAMLRSCLYFNVEGIIIRQRNSAPFSGVTAKASSGAQEFINIVYCSSTSRLLRKLPRRQWQVVGLTLHEEAVDSRGLREKLDALHQQMKDDTPSAPQQVQQALETESKADEDEVANSFEEGDEREEGSDDNVASEFDSDDFLLAHDDSSSSRHILLVVGNEGRGLRPIVQQQCHVLTKITGYHDAQSNTQTNSLIRPSHPQLTDGASVDGDSSATTMASSSSSSSPSSQPPPLPSTSDADASRLIISNLVDSLNVSNALAVALYELNRTTHTEG